MGRVRVFLLVRAHRKLHPKNSVTAEALAHEWQRLGFVLDVPPQVAPAVLAADRRIYKAMRYGECGHRG